jgi:hypothetical protein
MCGTQGWSALKVSAMLRLSLDEDLLSNRLGKEHQESWCVFEPDPDIVFAFFVSI